MEHIASETSHIETVNHEDDSLPSTKKHRSIKKYLEDDGEPIQPRNKRRKIGDGEFSNPGTSINKNEPTTFVCEICVDDKNANESFGVKNCTHSYCRDCIKNYVALTKLQENITSISCPVLDCGGSLDPEHCRPILPPKVVARWETALRGTIIARSSRFYCPFKDCSTMLIEDETQVVTESKCPNYKRCKRMFCAQCKVPWHAEIGCEEFQKLNEDEREKEDIMLRNLAQKMLWSRCPKCKFYVEKMDGCDDVWCWCGTRFHYTAKLI
ncbi:E3 ubiquitin-protein ligase RSL1-like [Argentina anserina]|uniref:E3 ubiquitin-protein ligase RSL1-like n=1 Tax=Argentina anserina TaxID=57926 RepID=UPI0021765C54|nr:E3 ubiquitin-protein ligase RSL1-like [Potentilla anserina]